MSTNVGTTDWVNLPAGTQPVSLWDSVHDAELRHVNADILARSLSVEVAVKYLVSFHGLPDGLTFTFFLENVQSVRVLRYVVWPGEFSMPHGLDWNEQQTRMAEYRSKWREESESWLRFETAVTSDEDVEITDGEVVSGGGTVALRLGVQMGGGEWYNVFVRGERLIIRRSDDQPIALAEFLALGSAYWEAFAKRKPSDYQP